MTDLTIRPATAEDAAAVHALIGAHLDEGHLLPRTIEDVRRHAHRFVVCDVDGRITACGELAPLSDRVAEIRSLVVAREFRRLGVAARVLDALLTQARQAGMDTVSTFTRDARFFVRQGFSIVPHPWVPEKIARDCQSCALFRQCGQFGLVRSLRPRTRYAAQPAQAAVA